MKSLAIVAITEKGCLLGEEIASEFSDIDLLTIRERKKWRSEWEDLSSLVEAAFKQYDGILFIMALGIVVRMISKHIVSKDSDPAIVVLDEQGNNTISLLSGHLGGGNKLTEEIAQFLNNNSVITTATDVNNIYALDSFASDYGLIVDPIKNIKKFNLALLEEKNIDILIDEGIDITDNEETKNFSFCKTVNYNNQIDNKKLIGIISNKVNVSFKSDIFLRPKNIILGVGCKKNYPTNIFEDNLLKSIAEKNISIKSIKEIRSIHLKKDEKCLKDFSIKYKIPFKTYSAADLNREFEKHHDLLRSEFVFKNTGTYGVAEPAALISENDKLNLISRRIEMDGMTIAISEESPIVLSKSNKKWLRRN